MAKKMNAPKFAREIHGDAKVVNRRYVPPVDALSLMQRPPPSTKALPPRRRLQITIDGETSALIPQSVKITHAG
jgi:hypothetical protein